MELNVFRKYLEQNQETFGYQKGDFEEKKEFM